MTLKILRKWDKTDIENLVKYANNEKIANNLRDSFPHPYTKKDGQNWLLLIKNEEIFAVTNSDNEAIGSIGLTIQNDIHSLTAELGYWLSEDYWNQGIITKAIAEIIDYGFNELRLERIFATPFKTNIGSCKVLEKNNFIKEGILRNNCKKNGIIYDNVMYAIIKKDYLNKK